MKRLSGLLLKRLSGLLIGGLFALLTLAAWGFANRPTAEPAWPSRIQGFAFQPFQKDQDPNRGHLPTLEQIDSDLKLLAGKTQSIRTYSSTGTPAQIPAVAAKHGVDVTVGAWLSRDRAANEREVAGAIRLAKLNRNVSRVIVGNEVMLRGDLAYEDLVAQIRQVRKELKGKKKL